MPGPQLDHRAQSLSRPLIRQSHHHRVNHGGVETYEFLDFRRPDVLAVANDDVLEASGDGDETFVVDGSQITGADEASFVKGGHVQ